MSGMTPETRLPRRSCLASRASCWEARERYLRFFYASRASDEALKQAERRPGAPRSRGWRSQSPHHFVVLVLIPEEETQTLLFDLLT